MTIKGSFKEECQQVLKDIEKEHGSKDWFIAGYIDTDDHGPHVVIKVKGNSPIREKVRHPNNAVKVCVILMQL